jgi:hypothetical protein
MVPFVKWGIVIYDPSHVRFCARSWDAAINTIGPAFVKSIVVNLGSGGDFKL